MWPGRRLAHAVQRKTLSAETRVSDYYHVEALTPAASSAPLLLENLVAMCAAGFGPCAR